MSDDLFCCVAVGRIGRSGQRISCVVCPEPDNALLDRIKSSGGGARAISLSVPRQHSDEQPVRHCLRRRRAAQTRSPPPRSALPSPRHAPPPVRRLRWRRRMMLLLWEEAWAWARMTPERSSCTLVQGPGEGKGGGREMKETNRRECSQNQKERDAVSLSLPFFSASFLV